MMGGHCNMRICINGLHAALGKLISISLMKQVILLIMGGNPRRKIFYYPVQEVTQEKTVMSYQLISVSAERNDIVKLKNECPSPTSITDSVVYILWLSRA